MTKIKKLNLPLFQIIWHLETILINARFLTKCNDGLT